jgi:hypothetical protein
LAPSSGAHSQRERFGFFSLARFFFAAVFGAFFGALFAAPEPDPLAARAGGE